MNRREMLAAAGACGAVALLPTLSIMAKQDDIVIANLDGVADFEGDYFLEGDIQFDDNNYYVEQDFKKVVGYCKLRISGNKLVMYDYVGKPIKGFPSVKGYYPECPKKGRLKQFEMISVGISDTPNVDLRIQKVSIDGS